MLVRPDPIKVKYEGQVKIYGHMMKLQQWLAQSIR